MDKNKRDVKIGNLAIFTTFKNAYISKVFIRRSLKNSSSSACF